MENSAGLKALILQTMVLTPPVPLLSPSIKLDLENPDSHEKLHTDDSDCFAAWQATCRYPLRRGAGTAGQDVTQSRVLRLQMVEITDSITLLRRQENMAVFWLVAHTEGC